MILTDYYCFERLASKAKLRMDCIASTGGYDELEMRRASRAYRATEKRDAINVGGLIIYYGDVPDQFGGNVHEKASKCLTIKGNNLSSIYVPNVESGYAFGDFRGTNDALLFAFSDMSTPNGTIAPGSRVEIFIARGQRDNALMLYNMASEGDADLQQEMADLRARARKEGGNGEE